MKYGSRQEYVATSLLVIGFVLGTFLLFKVKSINYLFILFLGATGVLIINQLVDGESLNSDRWSAMSVAIESIAQGTYPYTAIDHMGGRSSHLPGMLLIGAPFYLLGDVGLLQLGALLLFAFALIKSKKNVFLILGLLFISPAYWWEVYAKSDLLSNFLIIISCYLLFENAAQRIITRYPLLLGLIILLLLLTRFTSIIPIAIFLMPFCLRVFNKKGIKTVIGGLIGLMFSVIIISPWSVDWTVVMNQNPIELQNRFVPMWLSMLTFAMAITYGGKSTITSQKYFPIAIILLVPILFSFGVNISEGSFYNSLYNSSFDISYFNMVLPFVIMAMSGQMSSKIIVD